MRRGGIAGFKTRPSTFRLSLAPTGRAKCRGCKRVVSVGEMRLETLAFVRPDRFTTFIRHLECVNTALANTVVATHGTVEHVPVDTTRADTECVCRMRACLAEAAAVRC